MSERFTKEQLAAAIVGSSYFTHHHKLYRDHENAAEKRKLKKEWRQELESLRQHATRADIDVTMLVKRGRDLAQCEYQADHPELVQREDQAAHSEC